MYSDQFTKGIRGINSCPQGYYYITSIDECERAVAALEKLNIAGHNNKITHPKGCYYKASSEKFYFNSHATGSASTGRQPVCQLGMLFCVYCLCSITFILKCCLFLGLRKIV